jgi:hypothetical protein
MWGLGPTEAVSGFAEGIKHGVKSGYYECLANCMFADKGHLLPPAIAVGFERFMEHLIEHGGADWIARSIYKAPTLEQWNYYSKIVVPRASYTLKLAGRDL